LHRIFDDVESLSYVFLLLCLQWMKASQETPGNLDAAAQMLFSECSHLQKSGNLSNGEYTNCVMFESRPTERALRTLLRFTSSAHSRQHAIDTIVDDPHVTSVLQERLNIVLDHIQGTGVDQAAGDSHGINSHEKQSSRPSFSRLLEQLLDAKRGP
jgi:hypothetical protein